MVGVSLFGIGNFFIFYLLFSKEMFWCVLFFVGGYYTGTNYGMNHRLTIGQQGVSLGEWKVITADSGKFTVAGWDIYIRENVENSPPPGLLNNIKNFFVGNWSNSKSDSGRKES